MKLLTKILKSPLKGSMLALGLALTIAIFAVASADLLYHPKKMVKRGFKIELSADGKPIVKKEKVVDLASLMKVADAEHGAKIFKKCATCHTVGKGEAAKIGPNLYKVVGRKKASTNFSYSNAMKAKGGSWDIKSIDQFIKKPKDFVPGTKMAFPGLRKAQDRADVILFLQSQ